ncbi:MAG: hypothetical protein LBG81_03725, partial [Coriobacteriaceae bacterium]|nr:hypothetical protein [Coriobacteriaceae bacterium]
MKHSKKAISCLIALILLMPSANAFAQEAPEGPAAEAAQALPQQDGSPGDGSQGAGLPADGGAAPGGTGRPTAPGTGAGDGTGLPGSGAGFPVPGTGDAVPGTGMPCSGTPGAGTAAPGAGAATPGTPGQQGTGSAPASPDNSGSQAQAGAQDASGAGEGTDAPEPGASLNDEGQGLALAPYDQSGAAGSALRPATTEQFQLELTKTGSNIEDFIIYTNGRLNPNGGNPFYGKNYAWWIDWGDGTPAGVYTDASSPDGNPSANDPNASGISHAYGGNAGDVYLLTIMPAGSMDSWLGSLGGFKDLGYYGMRIDILSPLTPLMTRSASQVANPG